MTTVIYQIPNISCNHCVHTIKSEVGELNGVLEVLGDVETKKVTITFDPPASSEKIEELLAEINYPVAK
jgi:copper ion binding protein